MRFRNFIPRRRPSAAWPLQSAAPCAAAVVASPAAAPRPKGRGGAGRRPSSHAKKPVA